MAAAAAQEPARSSSSSGSADSYIGSLISLTSKSEIRYEGVLFNINTEESSIGLRNVRSFGTEGRRKDGPQVPPSDKVYEYILFRGSDIKDLQVKSSPPVQSTAPIHHDPAIIQSHYPPPTMPSTSLPPSGAVSVSDPTTNTSQLGIPRPTLQGSPPLYQPGANLGGWVSSPLPTSNNGGLPMPMYWQGLYGGPPNGPQGQHVAHQQPLLQPPPGLSMLPSMQQPMQYPPMNLSLHTGASQLSEQRPSLLPPFSTGNMNLMPPMLSAQSSAVTSDPSANLTSVKSSTQTLPTTVPSNSLPLLPPLTTALENTAVAPSVSEGKSALLSKNMPESASSIVGTSNSILNDGKMPALVTPGQLLQPGMPTVSSSQSSQTVQKDVEVVQLTSSDPLLRSVPAPAPAPALAPGTTPAQVTAPTPAPAASAADVQEPILPLPPPASRRLHGAHVYTPHYHHRGRGRGRGSELSRSATRFTEDFDFTAMNEKFNKDEVWGHLGKSNRAQEDGDDLLDEENVGSSKNESNPTYVKDDFFDSLSCDALDGGSRNGRPRFSEQVRRDTETFGNFPRYHGGRGGRGPYRGGGRGRGPYHGRGYGYGYGYNNRGRGGYGMSRHAP